MDRRERPPERRPHLGLLAEVAVELALEDVGEAGVDEHLRDEERHRGPRLERPPAQAVDALAGHRRELLLGLAPLLLRDDLARRELALDRALDHALLVADERALHQHVGLGLHVRLLAAHASTATSCALRSARTTSATPFIIGIGGHGGGAKPHARAVSAS